MSQDTAILTSEQQDAMQLAIEAQVNLLNIEFRKFYDGQYNYEFEKRVGVIEDGLIDPARMLSLGIKGPLTTPPRFNEDDFVDAFARIECHYFVNQCFMEPDQLLRDADRLRTMPGVIVHGRYDVVCPLDNAWALYQSWPEAELRIVSPAGHAASEPGIVDALITATQAFADRLA